MIASRTARPSPAPPAVRLFAACVAGLVALCIPGCDAAPLPPDDPFSPAVAAPGSGDPAWLTSREALPAPNPDRLDYDPQKRRLTFYELPGNERWMVQLPAERTGRAVGPHHRLPEGVDTRHTFVYYVRAGEKVSAPVTVATIEACRTGHTSFAQR
jgi:hypothetical protein